MINSTYGKEYHNLFETHYYMLILVRCDSMNDALPISGTGSRGHQSYLANDMR